MQIRSKKSGFCCKLKGKFGKKRQNLPHFAFRDPLASIPAFRDAKNGRYPGISGSRYIPLGTLVLAVQCFAWFDNSTMTLW